MVTLNSMKNLSIGAIGTIFLALVFGNPAHAGSITSYTDPLLSGASVIDFENAPGNSNLPGFSFNSLKLEHVTFSTPVEQLGYINSSYGGGYNTQGKSLQNTYTAQAFTSLKMSFDNTVTAFGFNWGASNIPWILTAFDANNNILDSLTLPVTEGSNNGDFFGLSTPDQAISYATLTAISQGDWVLLDNFKYVASSPTAVPEPATMLGLLAFGAIGVTSMNKRKQQQKATVKA